MFLYFFEWLSTQLKLTNLNFCLCTDSGIIKSSTNNKVLSAMTMITDNGDRKGGYLDILLAAVDFAAPANANHHDSCSTSNGLCGNQMDLHESKAAFDGNERDTSEFSLPFDAWKSSGSNPPAETSRVDTLKHLLQRNQGGKFDVKKASLGVMAEISSGTPKNNQVTKLQLIKNEQVLPHSSSCPQLDNSKSQCSGKLKDGKDDELAKFDVVTSSEDAVDCTLSIQAFGDYGKYLKFSPNTESVTCQITGILSFN